MRQANNIINKRIKKITAAAAPSTWTMSKRPRKDTRQADREKIFKPAILAFGDIGEVNAADCIVSNLSADGAGIIIDRCDAFPKTVTLKIGPFAMKRDAQIVWNKNSQYGLRFLDSDETQATSTR